jgi:hypothetical protein
MELRIHFSLRLENGPRNPKMSYVAFSCCHLNPARTRRLSSCVICSGIVLEWILKKLVVRACTGLVWVGIRTSGGCRGHVVNLGVS